jgi:hypothetical protein
LLQSAVEREQLARHLFPDFAELIPIQGIKVALEEIDHGEIARRLAVGDGGAFEDHPALEPAGMSEFPKQA